MSEKCQNFEQNSSQKHGRPQKLSWVGTLDILLILSMLLTMQCKCTFTQRFALSTPQRKCLLLRQQSQKSRFVGAAILLYHSRFFSHCAVQNYEAYRYQQSLSRSMPKMSAFNSHVWFCYSCGYHKICCHHVISER